MWINIKINNSIASDCPACGYRHSVINKLEPERRSFTCKRNGCEQEWDLCPTKEKANEIRSDLAELRRCARSLIDIANRVGTYGYDDDISVSPELRVV